MTGPLVRPFAALRPTPERAAEVAAPPYDVLSTEEARRLANGNPWSFLHISKPEIDLPPDTDPYSDAVYAKGADNLKRMIDEGVLERDARPCYYVYRLEAGEHTQTGIVAAGAVAAYEANRIRRHEFTTPLKEDDRVRQIDALGAQTGPVMVTHRRDAALSDIVGRVTATPPAYAVSAEGGVVHVLWVVEEAADIAAITDAFEAMEAIYIADGHHRSAAAARVAAARRQADAEPSPERAYESFLIVSFPDDEVKILDYNRVVADLGGHTVEAFLGLVGEAFEVSASDGRAIPDRRGDIGMYVDGGWYRLTPQVRAPADDPVAALDVSRLGQHLLEPVLGIGDPRTDPRIGFVGGVRGLGELERRVDKGKAAVAFALYPTALADLMAVADAGRVMPPKSTWFEPKLADGLVSLVID